MNTGLILVPHEGRPAAGVGVVLLPGWRRRQVVAAAQSAGFHVKVYGTWTSAGGNIGSRSELDRFRRSHPAA